MKSIKLLVSFMIVTLILSNFTFSVNAAESGTVLDKQRGLAKEYEVDVNALNKSELNYLRSKENSIKTIVEFRKDLEENNFENYQIENKNSKLKYSGQTDEGIVYMYISNDAYINKDTKELIVTTVIYDSYSDTIIQFLAEKRSMEDAEKTETLINWMNKDSNISENKKEDKIIIADKSVEKNEYTVNKKKKKKKKKFTFGKKSFACSMGGLLACTQYCGVWAMVNPGAGIVCSGVCGTAFNFACSVKKK